MQTQTDKQA